MKKFRKLAGAAFLILVLLVVPTASVFAETEPETTETTEAAADTADQASSDASYNHVWPAPPEIESESSFIMEVSTSAILYEKDADEKRYPASTTKILTALLAIENCSLDETVTFSKKAITLEEAATNIKAQKGEKMPMRDVLYGLMLASGNDCANAIAEHVAGSIPAFADMMNARAAEIGCTGTHFVNPHGLFDSEHYTTARDLALIAQEAFKNTTFVEIIANDVYYAEPTNKDPDQKKFVNWDLLLDEESEYYDPDVIGGKTGYLDEAGRCLVSYAERGGFQVISVQLKGGYTLIFDEAKKLLDYTFKNFSMQNASSKERRFAAPVEDAKLTLDPSAQILTLNSITFDQLESTLTFANDIDIERRADLELVAAERPGRSIYAVIDYSYAGHDLGSANIYLDESLTIAPASFTRIFYLSPVYLVLFVLVVLIALIAVFAQKKKRRPRPAGRAPSAPSGRRRR